MPSHLIHDQWIEGTGPAFTSINPATSQVLDTFHAATDEEVDQAVTAARNAFNTWSMLSLEQRLIPIQRFAELLAQERQQGEGPASSLPYFISEETGKPFWESLTELDAMINKIPLSIQAFHERRSPTSTSKDGQVAATRYKPHGVVAVFGPFNFPGHLPNGHIVPALIAGNTVVFKPSELTPAVARKTLELWQQAGLPPGVLNLVQGARNTGQALANHDDIDGLFFTGSVAGGLALMQANIDSPGKILALEMGGNNPLVAWDIHDDHLHAAALLALQSAYQTSGQRCSCARRLIIEQGPRGDALLARLLDLIPKIRIAPHTARPEPFMGPLIRRNAAMNALAAQERLLDAGALPLRRMESFALSAGAEDHGFAMQHDTARVASAFVTPGLIDVTPIARDVPDEEIFAPLLQVIRIDSFEQAISAANRTRFGLVAALLTDQPALYDPFFSRVKAGVINLNRPSTGASSALPFGGIGLSGNQRPSAYFAADYCSYPIASLESATLDSPKPLPGLP